MLIVVEEFRPPDENPSASSDYFILRNISNAMRKTPGWQNNHRFMMVVILAVTIR